MKWTQAASILDTFKLGKTLLKIFSHKHNMKTKFQDSMTTPKIIKFLTEGIIKTKIIF